jgi:hypothetical protein
VALWSGSNNIRIQDFQQKSIHDYPVLIGKDFPHKFAHYLGSAEASAGRSRRVGILNQTS